MNDLIQFILKNFFIVIIVVGFLFSLINKARKGNPRENRMPDFGSGPAAPRRSRDPQERQFGQPVNQPAQPARYDSGNRSEDGEGVSLEYDEPVFEEPLYDESPKLRITERTSPFQRRPLAQIRISEPSTAPKGGLLRNLDKNELRRAVVLAEVLGPPRSKRPHRRP